MAQRHEIEAWVNPAAWEDPAEAEQVIDAIERSGSDDEEDWVRLAAGGPDDERSAAERALARAEAIIGDELADYRVAERRMELARERLYSALNRAMASRHSAYRLAQVTEGRPTEAWIGRLRMQTGSPEKYQAWVERHYPGMTAEQVAEAMAADVEALRDVSSS